MKHSAHRIPRRLVTVSFAILLFAPAVARAAECPESSPEDPQERRKLAKEWFSAAETAENGGNDAEATRSYACSYKMVAHPFTAFNLGRVSERSGDNELALKMYKAYIALKPDAKDKDEVKGKIKALEEKMATGAAPAPADTGTAAAAPPEEPATEPTPDVLIPPPQPKPAEVVQKPAEPEPEPEGPSHTTEWIVGGVAGAALVGGIVTNLVARSKMSACQADANNGNYLTANGECNSARTPAYTSYVLFGVAGAGIALDAVLILLHRHSEESSSGGDDSSVGFMLLPGGGGISARGHF